MKKKEKISEEYLNELFEYYGIKTHPDKKGIWIKGEDGKLVPVNITKLLGLEKKNNNNIKTWETLKNEVKALIAKDKNESFDRTLNGMLAVEITTELERLKSNDYSDSGISLKEFLFLEQEGWNTFYEVKDRVNYIFGNYFFNFPDKNREEYLIEKVKLNDKNFPLTIENGKIVEFEKRDDEEYSYNFYNYYMKLLRNKIESFETKIAEIETWDSIKSIISQIEKIRDFFKKKGNNNYITYLNLKKEIYAKWRNLEEKNIKEGKATELRYDYKLEDLLKVYNYVGIASVSATELLTFEEEYNRSKGIQSTLIYQKNIFGVNKLEDDEDNLDFLNE
jgi:hypothetical protein